jgi:hypothetical protein
MVKQPMAAYMSTAIFRVVEMCLSVTCEGLVEFKSPMVAMKKNKEREKLIPRPCPLKHNSQLYISKNQAPR